MLHEATYIPTSQRDNISTIKFAIEQIVQKMVRLLPQLPDQQIHHHLENLGKVIDIKRELLSYSYHDYEWRIKASKQQLQATLFEILDGDEVLKKHFQSVQNLLQGQEKTFEILTERFEKEYLDDLVYESLDPHTCTDHIEMLEGSFRPKNKTRFWESLSLAQGLKMTYSNIQDVQEPTLKDLFSKCGHIKKLDISHNNLFLLKKPLLESIFSPLISLESLIMEDVNFGLLSHSQLRAIFSHLPNLKVLYLGKNCFSHHTDIQKLDVIFRPLVHLQDLSLDGNNLMDFDEETMKFFSQSVQQIEHLDLANYDFSKASSPVTSALFSSLDSLRTIQLDSTNFEKIAPNNLEELAQKFTNVTYLNLACNQIDSMSEEALGKFFGSLPSLKKLDLWECNISALPPQKLALIFGSHPYLRSLTLSGNAINGLDLGQIQALGTCIHRLKHLSLSYNGLYEMPQETLQALFEKLGGIININLSDNVLSKLDDALLDRIFLSLPKAKQILIYQSEAFELKLKARYPFLTGIIDNGI